MLQVVEQTEQEFDLGELQKKLERSNYFGTITFVWKHGKIVTIHEERVLKPFEVNIYFK